MLERLFPRQADNRYEGLRAALWLLGLLIALRLVVSLNSIFNTASVASGADGIPLHSFGPAAAREVLLLFALAALGHLVLAVVSLIILLRYRALVPLIFLVSLGEQLARRFIVDSQAIARGDTGPVAWSVIYGTLAVLALGLILSLIPRRRPGQG